MHTIYALTKSPTPNHIMPAITINIKSSGDKKYEVEVDTESTIEDLKTIISAQADVPPERQRLIYSGKVLKDQDSVEFYKIQTGHTVHLVKSAAKATSSGSSAVANSSTSSTGATAGSTETGNSGGVPSNIAAGQGAFNPLADLTGARYAGYSQLPSASMFGPDGGMGQFPDPELLSAMALNPMFQEQMNSLLLNPQMVDFMINQNPQLRAMGPQVRAMLQSPMFREMISNPESLRAMMSLQGGAGAAGGAESSFPAPGSNPTVGADEEPSAGSGDAAAAGSGAAAAANPLASLFGNGAPPFDPSAFFGGAAPAASSPPDNRPPEERYESQLRQLNDMGFFDFDQNVAALRRSGGSVQGAIEHLLANF